MAATASFKQQCPSCEAWVPIRDPNLIGKKIDCPKCKYRFVVEDPGTAAEDEEQEETPAAKKGSAAAAKRPSNGKGTAVKGKAGPRRRDEDDEDEGQPARGKGKGGGSTKLVLGIGLGVVAVGILVAVAIFMFMNNEPPKTAPRPAAPTVANQAAPAAPAEPAEAVPEEGDKSDKPPAAAATTATAATAGVPGSPEVLTNLLPPETEGVCNVRMRDLLRTSLGRTIFATPGAFRSEAIQQRLGLAVEDIDLLVQAWNFTHNWSFNVIHTTRPINQDALKAALRARPAPEGKIEDQEYFIVEPNAWLDSLGNVTFATLLQINPAGVPARTEKRALRFFDDQTLVLADLTPLKQFLAVKGRFPPKLQPKEAAPKDATAEEPAAVGRPIIPRGRRGAPAEPEPADTEAAQPAPSGSYLTINPNLKSMLDVVERKQPVTSLALDTQAARGRIPPPGLSILQALLNADTLSKLALKTILEEAGVLGASLQLKDGLALTLAEDCQNEDAARKRSSSIRRDTGPELVTLLSTTLGTRVELLDEDPNNPDNPPASAQTPIPGPGGRGMPYVPPPPRPGVMGGGRPGPGPSGGSPYGPSFGRGGNLPTEAPPPERPKPGSTIQVEIQEKTLLLVTISLTDQSANNQLMHGKIRQLVLQQKGYLDMTGGQLRIHELGDAARRYVEAHAATFPRGTVERPIPSTRAGRPYEPKQRVSWLAELLPYLGPEQAGLHRGIEPNKSWNDPENLGAAATLVPQFLNPNYPPNTWWVRYPGMTEPTAATHYVGIAGIGADAAEYRSDDPAMAKKLGIFGYDRATKLQDVTDGAANTIMMAQVPPTHKRPWMAGGGSTVEGVREQGSVRPFVSPQPDGKRGTLVVMADGSVRFVSEDVKDDIFKALCTIKGGESGIILDRDAVPVPRPEGDTQPPPTPTLPASPASAAPAGGGTWKEFTSKEGRFTVSFPGDPKEMKESEKTPVGVLEIHGLGMDFPKEKGAYGVIYFDMPGVIPDQPGVAEKFLEAIPQQVKAGVRGATISGPIKKITQDGYPGQELNLDLPEKEIAIVRLYLVKNRWYRIIVGGPKEFVSSPEAQRFLDSFHLGDK
jgi:hypothetical protein